MKVAELFETEERSVLSIMGKRQKWVRAFDCSHRDLESLAGSPTQVATDFDCRNNLLTSLIGSPKIIGRDMLCNNNKLISLEGAPSSISGDLFCHDNKLTLLKGIHKQIKHIGGHADFTNNLIKSHVLGLLKIEGLVNVALDNKIVQEILNKYLEYDKDIFACQEELIEAGYPEYAQL